MNDLISRQAAIDLISREEVLALIDKHLKLYKSEEQIHTHYELCTLAESIREELPVIESRSKGKWKQGFSHKYKCNRCEQGTDIESNYCAWCGADMRGEG